MIDIRTPQINGKTEKEQLSQVRSYLYQLAEQLQWALKNVDTSTDTVVVAPTPRSLLPAASQTTESAEATFGSIKALIIKSADIVNAYYEEINKKLIGEYVGQSDFGTFREQTIQEIVSNSTAIEQYFTNIQEITDAIDNIDSTLREVNAYIRSGVIYIDDNDNPVYGLEIGQTDTVNGEKVFSKFARFTSDRLSFYDRNGTEVAYISDYKIHITHAEVQGTLKIGGYLVDTRKGLTFKWVGRS